MATIEELSAALVKADAAGNAADAKAFADEIRRVKQTSVPAVSEIPAPRAEVPAWARKYPQLYGVAGAARETLGPLLEMGGMVGGGVVGSGLGPAGTVGGAGLGYGIGKEATRLADIALGNAPAQPLTQTLPQAAQNVLEGATMEAGGRVLVPAVVKAGGYVIDAFTGQLAPLKAAKIAQQSLGPDLAAAQAAARANPTATFPEAIANINSPTAQALANRMLARDPRFVRANAAAREAENVNALTPLAQGQTQTETIAARDQARQALNAELIPTLQTELNAANIAAGKLPQLEGQATRFGKAAANKVEDVRRFTAAGERAGEMAKTWEPTTIRDTGQSLLPRYAKDHPAYQWTYPGQLATKAEEVATQAAEGSLRFGEAARFSQAAADSLAAHGLKPLTASSVTQRLAAIVRDPELAGNKDVITAINRVGKDINEWSNSGGVIDAFALDSIRKNSVNAVVKKLSDDPTVQKQLAAEVTAKVRPYIVRAIEDAGGTGYGDYLQAYQAGRHVIDQSKMSAEALKLYRQSPAEFVKLVEGNSPDAVRKIFGANNYDIAKEMSADAMGAMRGVVANVKRGEAIAEQTSAGQQALRELLVANTSKFRIPWGLSIQTASTNAALDTLQNRLNKKVMNTLTEAYKSGVSADKLLNALPLAQRAKVRQAIESLTSPITAATGNALAPPPQNQNRLAPQ